MHQDGNEAKKPITICLETLGKGISNTLMQLSGAGMEIWKRRVLHSGLIPRVIGKTSILSFFYEFLVFS